MDLIAVITADHRAIDEAFVALETGTGDPADRRALVEHVIAELVRHAVAEEQFLYPTARARLPDGEAIAERMVAEHTESERVMRKLEQTATGDPLFEQLLARLIRDVREHVRDEEQTLLPRLRSACAAEELRELGANVVRAKEIAPTRPHRFTPHTPPANLIIGPGIGIVDRIRDRLTGRET